MLDVGSFQILFVILVTMVSAIIGALSGAGGGVLVLPFLVPIVGVKGVVPVMAIAMFFGNFSRVWVYREDIRFDLLARLCIAVTPGVVLGTYIYNWLPAREVAFIIGIFLIATVGLRRVLRSKKLYLSPNGISGATFSFGVLTGATPGAGIVMIAVLLGMGLSGTTLIATDAVLGMLAALIKAFMFTRFDLIDLRGLLIGLAIGVSTIPGSYMARWMIRRMPFAMHELIIEVMIAIAGLSFLWRATNS